ncbi:MAG: hypothetical protein ACK4SL_00195 [Candidatus Paceibacteria bacterium]
MKNVLIIFCFFFLFINHVSAETVTIYGSTGDGHLGTPWGVNDWTGQRMATTGRDVDYTGSQVEVLSFIGSPSTWTSIYRGFLVFDTSVIPDNAEIISASTSIYTNVVHNDDNDTYAYMGLYQGMQNSTSSIDVGDIDQCSDSLNSPTAGAATIDIDNFSVNTYSTFGLNSTGKSWIDKAGYTKLCFREGHDAGNDQISGGQYTYSGFRFRSAEAAGTSTDPYMKIEYILP